MSKSNAPVWIVLGSVGLVILLLAAIASVLFLGARRSEPIVPVQHVDPAEPVARAPDDWIDATKASAKQGDIVVEVRSAAIDHVTIDEFRETMSDERFLVVRIRIHNKSETRKAEYRGWGYSPIGGNREGALAQDNFGNFHKRIHFGLGSRIKGQRVSESIFPESVMEDLLVFDRPVDRADFIRLELPSSAVGGTGSFKFTIPRSMIVSLGDE